MATPFEEPAIPSRTEEDTLEQQLPVIPDVEEDEGAADPIRPHGDPLLPGGSEADRLDQERDGSASDSEDDYPRDAGEEFPEAAD
ncbi:hypothetical protein ITX31_09370 [Arthrobacter gandavensis]|uniref:hypothetical protein n=1 Tax=Arthrobacter gandavensis TaxID=169960 RepID=UPI00188E6CEF|nr:hypothetical protein [Arthrobacter gandavensis]MBF4994320.1 hypothetical protein [Arthrobacter gandavensis]